MERRELEASVLDNLEKANPHEDDIVAEIRYLIYYPRRWSVPKISVICLAVHHPSLLMLKSLIFDKL